MILRRLGNKKAIMPKLIQYFPEHTTWIEPFFGSGSVFFYKKKAKYNFLNDIDSNVYNCFDVIIRHKEELKTYLELIPIHIDFWNECKTRTPDNNIEKAVYFLFLSNFGYMGKPDTFKYSLEKTKDILLKNLELTYKNLVSCENKFLNCDFRELFKKISLRNERGINNSFIYCDPPYFNTTDNYSHSFTQQDSIDLFNTLQNTGIKWAMSEFDNPFIIQQARERNLNIIIIGERRNIKNIRTEILITNYRKNATLFD